jgi:hypothetical protein
MRKYFFLSAFLGLSIQFLLAQSPNTLKVRAYTKQNSRAIINEYVQFLSLPNVANDSVGIKSNAAFIMDMMIKRGIQKVQLLTPATLATPPAVYGEVITMVNP